MSESPVKGPNPSVGGGHHVKVLLTLGLTSHPYWPAHPKVHRADGPHTCSNLHPPYLYWPLRYMVRGKSNNIRGIDCWFVNNTLTAMSWFISVNQALHIISGLLVKSLMSTVENCDDDKLMTYHLWTYSMVPLLICSYSWGKENMALYDRDVAT